MLRREAVTVSMVASGGEAPNHGATVAPGVGAHAEPHGVHLRQAAGRQVGYAAKATAEPPNVIQLRGSHTNGVAARPPLPHRRR